MGGVVLGVEEDLDGKRDLGTSLRWGMFGDSAQVAFSR